MLELSPPAVVPVVTGSVVATETKEGSVQKPAAYAPKGFSVTLYALMMKSKHVVAAFPYTVGA